MIEVSMDDLIYKMMNLQVDETLDFFEYESGGIFGVVKVKHFNINMLLINCYGGRTPLVIPLNEHVDSDELNSQVLERFKAYCGENGMNRLLVSLEPKAGSLCPEAQEMRGRKKNALLSQDMLMKRLSQGGYTDRTLAEIRDEYAEVLGFDPVWRYPFCHDGKLGAVLVPVQEGFLWLPYSVIDAEDNEKYEPENTALLDAKTCEWLIEEMGRYTEPLTAVMRYVAEELRETEELTKDRECVGVCSICPCIL